MKKIFTSINSFFARIGSWFSGYFLLIIRLFWGLSLCVAGFGKLVNVQDTAGFFAALEIPYPVINAYLVGGFECFGGLFIAVGLLSRIFAFPLIVILCTAYATAHYDAVVVIFQDPTLFISQSPFAYLYTMLVIFCFGPGRFSLDKRFGIEPTVSS